MIAVDASLNPRWLNMMISTLALATLSLLSANPSPSVPAEPPARPNFIVINIDDLGYADIGPFGSKINRTPNLDRMAKEGRKLTAFYAAPVCSPSRAALMTGCYPKRSSYPERTLSRQPQRPGPRRNHRRRGAQSRGLRHRRHRQVAPRRPAWSSCPRVKGSTTTSASRTRTTWAPPEDGVKSDLGKPLPKSTGKGPGQPPLPLLRGETVVKRVLPDDQQSLVELYTADAVEFILGTSRNRFSSISRTTPFTSRSTRGKSGPGNLRTESSPTGWRRSTGAWARYSTPFASRGWPATPW